MKSKSGRFICLGILTTFLLVFLSSAGTIQAAEKKEAAPAKKPKAKAAQDARHIQQLLKAKRRAKENEPKD